MNTRPAHGQSTPSCDWLRCASWHRRSTETVRRSSGMVRRLVWLFGGPNSSLPSSSSSCWETVSVAASRSMSAARLALASSWPRVHVAPRAAAMVAVQEARAGAWARRPSRRLLADNADDQRDRRRRRHSSAKCRQAHAWAEPRQREKAQANDRARRPQPSPADGCRHDSDRAGQRDGLGADDGDIPAIDGFTSDRPLPNTPCQHGVRQPAAHLDPR